MADPRYGRRHQNIRAAIAPLIAEGNGYCRELVCLERTRWIPPGTPWDLAHNHETGQYLGPAHQRCNRADGGRRSPTAGQHGWARARRRHTRAAATTANRW